MGDMSFSRRAILSGTPAAVIGIGAILPAAAAVAIDPIFDVIEKYKAALADGDKWSDVTDVIRAGNEGREISQSDLENDDRASKLETYWQHRLITTVPLTLAGLKAYLSYFSGSPLAEMDPYLQDVVDTLLKSPVFASAV